MPEPLRLLCADLSLRCPGFALLSFKDHKIFVESLCHLDNRNAKAGHGKILTDIYEKLLVLSADANVFVREKGFSRFPHETQALFKVVGIADLVAWQHSKSVFHEIAPAAVKRLLTGSGKASKAEVAAALERFIGRQEYATDDESDAAAVGIAWLIENKPDQ